MTRRARQDRRHPTRPTPFLLAPPREGRERSDRPVPVVPRRHPEAARQARPLEPILLLKLRIAFADFPYLHCSID